MKPAEQLAVAAAKVAGRAAGDWDEFLAALRAYKDDQLNLMAQANPSMVQLLQGRAQHAIDLLKQLEQCREKARSIQESMNVKR